jgi:hypothetical protein
MNTASIYIIVSDGNTVKRTQRFIEKVTEKEIGFILNVR